jgi:hypothetical protein
MNKIRIRPRFKIWLNATLAEVQQHIERDLNKPDSTCQGVFTHGHFYIKLPQREQHFWSPQLNVSLEPSENGTIIRGLYGPNPTLWVFFALCYGALGILILFISIVGLSNWSLDIDASILWIVPILLLIMLGIYVFNLMGKNVAAKQMQILQHFINTNISKFEQKTD